MEADHCTQIFSRGACRLCALNDVFDGYAACLAATRQQTVICVDQKHSVIYSIPNQGDHGRVAQEPGSGRTVGIRRAERREAKGLTARYELSRTFIVQSLAKSAERGIRSQSSSSHP